ncbi:MAG: hypothetical protein H7177_02525 [Rhizobacter sp.]|nr:hypothetical protein [Bacteriovorax sp.]
MYFLNQIFAGISILRENFYSFSYLYLWAEVSLCGYVLNAFKNHEILETNSQLNLIILFSFISVYFWERRLKIFCAIVGTKAGRIGAVLIGGVLYNNSIKLFSFDC